MGYLPEAAVCYRRAIQGDPRWEGPYLSLAQILQKQGLSGERSLVLRLYAESRRLEAHRHQLDNAVTQRPRDPEAQFAVGDQHLRDGRADEALTLYTSIFKDTAVDGILRYQANEAPDEEGKIKHAQFMLNGQKFMIMESAAAHLFNFTEGISLTIYCQDQDEIDYYWEELTEGGAESMCGWLKDKFGVSWQIVPTILNSIMSDPSKAGKAAQAFMSMRKLNIEQIVQAAIS